MENKPMTIDEYVIIAKVSKPAISYRINAGKILPGIDKYEYDTSKRIYNLYPSKNIDTLNISELFRSH